MLFGGAPILESSVSSFIGLMTIKFQMLWTTASFGMYLSKNSFFNPLAFPGKATRPFKVNSYNSLQHMTYLKSILQSKKIEYRKFQLPFHLMFGVTGLQSSARLDLGLESKSWIFSNFFELKIFFQGKSIGYKVTSLYQFLICSEL